jgi:SAM-dependent methyltransferase
VTDYDSTSERMDDEAGRGSANAWFIYLCHVATYEFARPYAEGKTVLDYGCGTGYGTARLATSAASIVGIDVAPGAIAFATERYGRGVAGERAPQYRRVDPVETAPLPFPDNHFDTVTSFQVIEHVPSVPNYLAEIRRVLKPGGTFLCATPDRTTRLFKRQQPFNMFHLEEWGPEEFQALLSPVFEHTQLYRMSAPPHVVGTELRRCKRTRTIAYPFTFAHAPEWWRQAGLRALKALDGAANPGTAVDDPEAAFGFGLDAITIAPDATPSVNIVTVSS